MKTRAWDGERFRDDYVVMPDGTLRQLTYNKNYAAVLGGSVDWKLSRFTKLVDMEKTDVYEGHLLRYPAKDQWDESNYTLYEVFYHDDEARFKMCRTHYKGNVCGGYIPSFDADSVSKLIIVGDIYTTPELPEEVNK